MTEVSCPTCDRKTDTGRNCWWCETPIAAIEEPKHVLKPNESSPPVFIKNISSHHVCVSGQYYPPGALITKVGIKKSEWVAINQNDELVPAYGTSDYDTRKERHEFFYNNGDYDPEN